MAGAAPELTDDQILKMVHEHPGLLETVRAEADAQVRRARDLFQAPHEYITWHLGRLSNERYPALHELRQRDARTEPYLFRHYRAAVELFAGIVDRCTGKSVPDLREIYAGYAREMEQDAIRKDFERLPKAPPPAPFDARSFVTELSARGIVLRSSRAGGVEATPTTKLTDADRTAIRSNLAAVKEAVTALTETF